MTEVSDQQSPQDSTPIWQSKTIWSAILVAAAPLLPPVAQAVITNPVLCSTIVGAVFAGLRLITKNPVKVNK